MLPHNKIIKTTVKRILEPEHLFQIGSSRNWVDDNGYFVILAAFQPSAYYGKTVSLEVGIEFLWETTADLNDTLGFAFQYRERVRPSYIEYKGDDNAFEIGVENIAKAALERVKQYRKFSDISYAKQCLRERIAGLPEERQFWEWYHLAMLCFLNGDFEEGKQVFAHYMNRLKNSFYSGDCYIEWHEEFYNYCVQNIQCNLDSEASARQMVVDMINRRRQFFCGKTSYKKMSRNLFDKY